MHMPTLSSVWLMCMNAIPSCTCQSWHHRCLSVCVAAMSAYTHSRKKVCEKFLEHVLIVGGSRPLISCFKGLYAKRKRLTIPWLFMIYETLPEPLRCRPSLLQPHTHNHSLLWTHTVAGVDWRYFPCFFTVVIHFFSFFLWELGTKFDKWETKKGEKERERSVMEDVFSSPT